MLAIIGSRINALPRSQSIISLEEPPAMESEPEKACPKTVNNIKKKVDYALEKGWFCPTLIRVVSNYNRSKKSPYVLGDPNKKSGFTIGLPVIQR
jgi:hypothetical protein